MMIMATMVPAWAANGRLDGQDSLAQNGTITIEGTEDGETYTIYKIFDLYSFNDSDPAAEAHDGTERYSYMVKHDTAANSWFTFIDTYYKLGKSSSSGAEYFKIDTDNPVWFDSSFNSVPAGTSGASEYYFVEGYNAFNMITANAANDEVDRSEAIAAGAVVQEFAKNALTWAKGKDPFTGTALTGGALANQGQVTNARGTNSTDITFTSVPLGWYLVESSIGTLVGLDTNTPDVTIKEKNIAPSITKQVKARAQAAAERDSSKKYADGVWVANADYEIGNTVWFLTKITIPKGANESYVLHDVMEEGFTLNTDSFKAYLTSGSTTTEISLPDTTKMTISTSGISNNSTFEVTFTQTWLNSLSNQDVLELEYSAVLNEKAVIYGDTETASGGPTTIVASGQDLEDGALNPQNVAQINTAHNTDGKNTNSAILTFGVASARGEGTADSLPTSTRWAVATVDTFEVDLVKTEEAASAATYPLLSGAVFRLFDDVSKVNTDANAMKLAFTDNTYRPVLPSETSITNQDITTNATNGVVKLTGLKAGTYYLKETKAPTGYNKIGGYYTIVITGDEATNNGNAPALSANGVGSVNVTYIKEGESSGTASGARLARAVATSGNYVATATYTGTSLTNGGLHVINQSGAELPSTGGMGTTVLYIVGGMLVILAGAYLFFSRKRTA